MENGNACGISRDLQSPFPPLLNSFHFSTCSNKVSSSRLSTKAIEQKSQLQPCRSCSSQLSPQERKRAPGTEPKQKWRESQAWTWYPSVASLPCHFPVCTMLCCHRTWPIAPLAEKVGEQHIPPCSPHSSQACDLFPLPFSIPYFHHLQYQDWLARWKTFIFSFQ